MIENIVGRKFELHPVELKENQIHCDFCGGIGWVLKDEKWLESCPHCSKGVIDCCPRCGKPYAKRYIHICDNPECIEYERNQRAKEDARKEAERYTRAEHLEPDGVFEKFTMLYSDYYPYNEGYFIGWDEFFDEWKEQEDLDTKRPEYVWATYPIEMSIDAIDILENATSELHEDAMSNIRDNDIKKLQDYLDNWCKKQTGTTTYYVDYSKAVMIPWEEY